MFDKPLQIVSGIPVELHAENSGEMPAPSSSLEHFRKAGCFSAALVCASNAAGLWKYPKWKVLRISDDKIVLVWFCFVAVLFCRPAHLLGGIIVEHMCLFKP